MKKTILWALMLGVPLTLAGCVPPPPATPSRLQTSSANTAGVDDHPWHPGHEEHANEGNPPANDVPNIPGETFNVPAVALPPDVPPAASETSAEAVTALEERLAAAPADEALKTEVANANYELGHDYMMDPALAPRQKYPTALKFLRRALTLRPQHIQARQDTIMIEGIYSQMGLPVPD